MGQPGLPVEPNFGLGIWAETSSGSRIWTGQVAPTGPTLFWRSPDRDLSTPDYSGREASGY
jgi:hypothetical protein